MKEIVHMVKIGSQQVLPNKGEHKNIHVACAEGDDRYVDMVHHFSHRLSLYTNNPFSFLGNYKDADGIMVVISNRTMHSGRALEMIDYALANNMPVLGVDVRSRNEGIVPDIKLTKLHWEGLSNFIDSL